MKEKKVDSKSDTHVISVRQWQSMHSGSEVNNHFYAVVAPPPKAS